jgi:hypothetical protein
MNSPGDCIAAKSDNFRHQMTLRVTGDAGERRKYVNASTDIPLIFHDIQILRISRARLA